MKKLQLFVLQFCATSEFHSTLELQWHTCKNAPSHWYPWRMSPVRSGAMECGILGTQLPLPTAAPAAPTAFGDGPPVNRKGSLAGFQQTSSPHNPHAFPKMPLLLLQRFQLFCGSSGSPAGGEGTLLDPSCSHPCWLAAISGSWYPTETTSFCSPAGRQNLQPWQ